MNSVENKIPKTGRIGRFAKIMKKEVPKELVLKFLKRARADYSPIIARATIQEVVNSEYKSI
ncbi:MAG: hypothetical protein PVF96_06580 [Candidatus Bathyarchaeota archaeon]